MSSTLSLSTSDIKTTHCEDAQQVTLNFAPITAANMPLVWSYLQREPGRTCDFSFGGVLMWVDLFHYEMAIYDDTLFIKGRLENDLSKVAFSLPVGKLSVSESIKVLKAYCRKEGLPLRFSAIPEYSMSDFMAANPKSIAQLTDWADYLYDAEKLATLSGKKMAKKRNHVNQYVNLYGEETYEPLTLRNLPDVEAFMDRLDADPAPGEQAAIERQLARDVLRLMEHEQTPLQGGLLRVDGRVVAFSVGDVKGDTLFVHIEKADREIAGSYEMINKSFAADMVAHHPEIRFINREDDAGDEGLRKAKQSYHPTELLKKYNVIF
ncbi:MAG: DUF2156 domain-containing protein [Bacteroidales bacterium]|nr:DUF2156 domain-containing protein [Bacteroidales bacterium]